MGFSINAAADPVDGYRFAFAFTGILMAVGSIIVTPFINPSRDAARVRESLPATDRERSRP